MSDVLRVDNPFPALIFEEEVQVRPWVDELIDTLGFDPRSPYVERFWLGILGPSTTWLLRRVVAGFDRSPAGFALPLGDTARAIGLGDKAGRHSPFARSLARACQFEVARAVDGVLEVRRKLPPLNQRQVARLPSGVQEEHAAWQSSRLGSAAAEAARRQARVLALHLLEMTPDCGVVEGRLVGLDVHPAVAREAAEWAWGRYTSAAAAAATAANAAEAAGATNAAGMTPEG